MATVKIIPISAEGHLKRACEYSMNADKTLVEGGQLLEKVVAYSTNTQKTLRGEWLVTGINCFPETAADKMMQTKKRYNKLEGRLGYHLFQSFVAGEVTPQVAHVIGVKYAEAWLADFEVVVSTHCDTAHVHNDIVINSVSCVDGHKLHMSRADLYEKIRGISEKLCEEYGLTTIAETMGRRRKPFDAVAHFGKNKSHRQTAMEDIEICIAKSHSLGDFYVHMENMGYEVNLNGKYPKIKLPEYDRYMRLDTQGYPTKELCHFISHKKYRQPVEWSVFRPASQRNARKLLYHKGKAKKLTYFQAMYLYWLYTLGMLHKNPKRSYVPISEYRKFEACKKQFRFLSDHNITKMSEVYDLCQSTETQIKEMDVARFKLLGAKKKYKQLFEAHATYERLAPAAVVLEQEQKDQLTAAQRLLISKRYMHRLGEVQQLRSSWMDEIAANKAQVSQLKADRKMLEGILETSPSIQRYMDAEATIRMQQQEQRCFEEEQEEPAAWER